MKKNIILFVALFLCFFFTSNVHAQSKKKVKSKKFYFSHSIVRNTLFNKLYDAFQKPEYKKRKLELLHGSWELGYALAPQQSLSYSFSHFAESSSVGRRIQTVVGEIFGIGGGVSTRYIVTDVSHRIIYQHALFPKRLSLIAGLNAQQIKIRQRVGHDIEVVYEELDMKNWYIGPELGLNLKILNSSERRWFLDMNYTCQYLGKFKVSSEEQPLQLGGFTNHIDLVQPKQLHGLSVGLMVGCKF